MSEIQIAHNSPSGHSLETWKGVYLREGERDALLALVPDPAGASGWQRIQALRDRAILSLFVYSGLRRNELRLLNRRDVDLSEGRIQVWHGKGGKTRRLPLHPAAEEAIRAYLVERGDPDPALFLSQRSQRISNRTLGVVLGRYLPGLELDKRVTLHALRRTFATSLYRKSKDIRLVQRALGHANINTTMLYVQLADDELADAVNLL